MNFLEKMIFYLKIFEEIIFKFYFGYEDLFVYREVMMNYILLEIKVIYIDIFDFSKKYLFYMIFNKFDM